MGRDREVYRLTVYTAADHAITFDVVASCPDFVATIAEAIENGIPIIETVDGEQLLLNGMGYVAITFAKIQYPPTQTVGGVF